MVDIWLRLVVRIDGNKITKAILLPKKLSDPGAILDLFSSIEKLCKNPKSDKTS
jgi:hypothetical protein